MIEQVAAWITAVMFLGMICFQILLAIGVPLGKAAWGGKHRVLPIKLRIASFFSALVLAFALIIVLERAEVITIFDNRTLAVWTTWIFTAYFGVNIFMNLMSKSRLEKLIMTPVASVLCLMCLIVALTSN